MKVFEQPDSVSLSTTQMHKLDEILNDFGLHRDSVEKAILYFIISAKKSFPEYSSQNLANTIGIALSRTSSFYPSMVERDFRLPDVAPQLYEPRKSGLANCFLLEHYWQYLEAGILFRPDIKRLDPKLEMALRNQFRGKPEALRELLPNKADEVSARFKTEFGAPIDPARRKIAAQALSYAKRAKTPKGE